MLGLSQVFERSWQSGEVPQYWRKASATLVFKGGKKEIPGSCVPIGLILIPEKVMKLFFLEVTSTHVVDTKMIALYAETNMWGDEREDK